MTDRYANIHRALEMGPTPGPWSIRETETHVTVIGADNEVLFHDDKRLPRVIADARLIATAPELLEALIDLLSEAESLRVAYSVERENSGWDSVEEEPCFSKARAAIAKATGGGVS